MKIETKVLIQSLDPIAKSYVEAAANRCIQRGGLEILVEDVLFVMQESEASLFNHFLAHYEIDAQKMKRSLQAAMTGEVTESTAPKFSLALRNLFEEAYVYAKMKLSSDEITEVALLLALFEQSAQHGYTGYMKHFKDISLDEASKLIEGLHEEASHKVVTSGKKAATQKVAAELDKYTIDLTAMARDGKIDPVLCRDDEMRQAIDILCRRRKNNPIMVGEAGVGKTAVVEGLALRIAAGEVPTIMQDAQILSLDLGALQAGASVKGEFERRLQMVISEIQARSNFMILFIDEAHTLIGAGGNEGGGDAANILKPALARGGLRTIAATTWLEYRKYFEKDPALSRRFQKINLLEPSVEDTITILRGISSVYEQTHGVYIEDEAFRAAAKLSSRYITGRQLPDKAIDVIDTACANVKISRSNRPFILQSLENKIVAKQRALEFLERDTKSALENYTKEMIVIQKEIDNLNVQLEEATGEWEEQKAAIAKIEELLKNEGDADELKQARKDLVDLQKKAHYVYENVTDHQVAEVISAWTGIPLGSMVSEQATSVMNLAQNMKDRIIGQDAAVDHIAQILQVSMAGLKKENAPSGVFLLAGPSGVGKTETALTIADLLYGGEKFITTINMTEFQEKHTISRLIGSPPGYVGYGEGGQLTDPVRIKPYSVVLLDEIEKAHPDILNLFYQIFDKGVANDGEGREIDFSNCTFVLTSNLGTQEITQMYKEDPDVSTDELVEVITPALQSFLKPALLGRMSVVPYSNLKASALEKIVRIKLGFVERQLKEKNIQFDVDQELIDYVISKANTVDTGARNIDMIINKDLLPNLSKVLLESSINQTAVQGLQMSIDATNQISVRSIL